MAKKLFLSPFLSQLPNFFNFFQKVLISLLKITSYVASLQRIKQPVEFW